VCVCVCAAQGSWRRGRSSSRGRGCRWPMHSPWQRGLARSRSRLTSSGFRNICVGGLTTPAPTAACASASDAAHQTQSPLGMRSTCVASSLRHSTPRPFECPAIARGKALVAPQNQACLPLRAPSAEPSDASRVPEYAGRRGHKARNVRGVRCVGPPVRCAVRIGPVAG